MSEEPGINRDPVPWWGPGEDVVQTVAETVFMHKQRDLGVLLPTDVREAIATAIHEASGVNDAADRVSRIMEPIKRAVQCRRWVEWAQSDRPNLSWRDVQTRLRWRCRIGRVQVRGCGVYFPGQSSGR